MSVFHQQQLKWRNLYLLLHTIWISLGLFKCLSWYSVDVNWDRTLVKVNCSFTKGDCVRLVTACFCKGFYRNLITWYCFLMTFLWNFFAVWNCILTSTWKKENISVTSGISCITNGYLIPFPQRIKSIVQRKCLLEKKKSLSHHECTV